MRSEPRWPVPPTERERLRELASLDVLHTPAEAAYDGLTEVAAALFDAPVAALSLMDADEQWFKAKVGIDLCGTPREIAFCAHAILASRTLVVEDMTLDSRFCANPLVVGEPHARFYAGAPLTTGSGERVGTLCVIDFRPRVVEPRLLRLLERLARTAVDLMEARRQVVRLSEPGGWSGKQTPALRR